MIFYCFAHLFPQRVKHGAVEELSGEIVICLSAESGEASVEQKLLEAKLLSEEILGGLDNAIIAINVTWELPRSEETLVLLLRLHESSESRGEDCERGR